MSTCRADTLERFPDTRTRNLSLRSFRPALRDNTLDLATECRLINGVHSTPRPLEAAIPGCKCLAKPQRLLQLRTPDGGQPRQPVLCKSMEDTSRTPIPSASSVSQLCHLVGFKAFPAIRPGTRDSAAIPKSLGSKRLDLKDWAFAMPRTLERPDPFVGVLQNVRQS